MSAYLDCDGYAPRDGSNLCVCGRTKADHGVPEQLEPIETPDEREAA